MVAEHAEHPAGHHAYAGLVNAARGHALMRRLGTTADAVRLEHRVEAGRNFGGQFLLNLQSLRKHFDQPGQLGNADHAIAWQIADMDAPMIGAM